MSARVKNIIGMNEDNMSKDIELDIAVENAKKALEKYKAFEELKNKGRTVTLQSNIKNRVSKNHYAF